MVKKIYKAFSNLRKRITSRRRLSSLSSSSSPSSIQSKINGGGKGMGIRSMSEESLNKLDDCIQNMNDDVSKLYMECPEADLEDDDPKLLKLLDGYFTTSEEITNLCKSLRSSLDNVQNHEYELIDEALQDFGEENGEAASSFRKTLKDLKSFNEFYNKYSDEEDDDELVKKSMDCRDDIVDMIVELEKMMKDINKDLKRVRQVRAVITVALIVPAIGLLAAKLILLAPILALTPCLVSIWKKSTKVLKMKKIVMVSMERGMKVALNEVEIIVKLVKRLRDVERLIRETAKFAVEKRSPVAEVMGGMVEEKEFMKSTIVDLDKETLRFDELSQFGRNLARKRIFEFFTPSVRDPNN